MIPRSFELLGHRITVVRETASDDEYACWHPETNTITVNPNLNEDLAWHSFCHELVHAIFDMLSYEDLTEDEVLVDQFGGLLAQAIKTFRDAST